MAQGHRPAGADPESHRVSWSICTVWHFSTFKGWAEPIIVLESSIKSSLKNFESPTITSNWLLAVLYRKMMPWVCAFCWCRVCVHSNTLSLTCLLYDQQNVFPKGPLWVLRRACPSNIAGLSRPYHILWRRPGLRVLVPFALELTFLVVFECTWAQ